MQRNSNIKRSWFTMELRISTVCKLPVFPTSTDIVSHKFQGHMRDLAFRQNDVPITYALFYLRINDVHNYKDNNVLHLTFTTEHPCSSKMAVTYEIFSSIIFTVSINTQRHPSDHMVLSTSKNN